MKHQLKKLLNKVRKTTHSYPSHRPPKSLHSPKKPSKQPFIEIGENWYQTEKPIAFMFGFNPWKRAFISKCFPEYRTAFVFGSASIDRLLYYFQSNPSHLFVVWGYKESEEVHHYAKQQQIPLIRVEDGFIRSLDLGAKHSFPLSIVKDSRGLYFNPQQPSDLEHILLNTNFDQVLLSQAQKNIQLIHTHGISKYNHAEKVDVTKIYGPKTAKRILVMGQVEDDASIKFGLDKNMTNNELVWAAYQENPNAEIIYKPHPDVLEGLREKRSDPKEVEHIAKVITSPLSVPDALTTIDHVYTFTSLSGFEALIRGINVTCFGMPFYSGWGLTDDRQTCERRTRTLTIEQLFAGAYMLYPEYMDEHGKRSDCEATIHYLSQLKVERANQHEMEHADRLKTQDYSNQQQQEKPEESLESIESTPKMEDLQNDSEEEKLKETAKKETISSKSESYLLKIKELQGRNQLREVEALYVEALEVVGEPKEKAALLKEFATFLIYKGEYSKRVGMFLYQSLELNPTMSTLSTMIDYFYKIKGATEEVLALVKRVMKKEEPNAKKLMKYAAIFNDAGHYTKAIQLYQQAVELNAKVNEEHLYLGLHAMVSERKPHIVGASNDAYELFKQIKEGEQTFEQLVLQSKGDICVVGNSPCELGRRNGAAIDEHALVIRFNNYAVHHPFHLDYGRKTDIWVKSGFYTNVKKRPLEHYQHIVVSGTNLLHSNRYGYDLFIDSVSARIPTSIIPDAVMKELMDILEAPPSAGLAILYWLYQLNGPLKKDHIFGFSFTDQPENQNAHYFIDPSNRKIQHHHWRAERELYERLFEENDVWSEEQRVWKRAVIK
ncbi:glycosyltransferase family 29 protein [Alkalihalobacillus pseudalcaliphilus]|uniref:glycosyltransferase family 29 protein n=1 Tax=Alkalihalobacillus pseudalcaliphilus TaxID=79884 RepID=UPI00069E1FB7|nr:glycosyltransferase family 29 protein [Alkalihalobacillus pseudalcaliphilus]